MFDKVFAYLKKPELYAQSTSKFWDDEHISKGMLASHLDPGWGASRPHVFMDQSVDWIEKVAPSVKYKNVLDLGCGPGLYAERLYKKGYTITGIDFSKRSIAYATEKAKERQQDIKYIYRNYLEMEYDNEFDLVILIYCDYAVLSDIQREILLKKIYKGMRDGGKFIFDVHTPKKYEGKPESNTWYCNEGEGFWKPYTYLCFESHYIYEENIRLDQYVIIDQEEKVDVFRVWDHCFTQDTIVAEIKKAGFSRFKIYADVAGRLYNEDSTTMCIVVEK